MANHFSAKNVSRANSGEYYNSTKVSDTEAKVCLNDTIGSNSEETWQLSGGSNVEEGSVKSSVLHFERKRKGRPNGAK